jgi:hypothetical protein
MVRDEASPRGRKKEVENPMEIVSKLKAAALAAMISVAIAYVDSRSALAQVGPISQADNGRKFDHPGIDLITRSAGSISVGIGSRLLVSSAYA